MSAFLLFVMSATVTLPKGEAPIEARLPITLRGKDYDLATLIYRPSGQGPFPLIIINHGTPADKGKLSEYRLGFARAARWFASRGYLVVVALRPGFGSSSGRYLEAAGSCRDEDFVEAGQRTAAIETAIAIAAAKLSKADPQRIVIVGQSAGGFGAVALGDVPPPGVKGVISFAGGRGSDGKEYICAGEDRLLAAENKFGSENRLPQLWLYAKNDHYFGPALAQRMAAVFIKNSRPPVTFVSLPPFGNDGHKTFANADPSVWAEPVTRFLDQLMAR